MPLNHRLPVFKIIAGALSIAWFSWREYLRVLAVPTLMLVSVWAVTAVFGGDSRAYVSWIALPLYGLAFALFAVTCHRFILLHASERGPGSIAIGRRELRFLVWMVGVYALVTLLTMLPLTLLININSVAEAEARADEFDLMQKLASIPAYYVLGRISLVFPAIAIDLDASLKWSWHMTNGNGWRMFIIVGLFPLAMNTLIWLVWRDEATVVEQALLSLCYFIGLSIEIFALSFSYLEFERHGS